MAKGLLSLLSTTCNGNICSCQELYYLMTITPCRVGLHASCRLLSDNPQVLSNCLKHFKDIFWRISRYHMCGIIVLPLAILEDFCNIMQASKIIFIFWYILEVIKLPQGKQIEIYNTYLRAQYNLPNSMSLGMIFKVYCPLDDLSPSKIIYTWNKTHKYVNMIKLWSYCVTCTDLYFSFQSHLCLLMAGWSYRLFNLLDK